MKANIMESAWDGDWFLRAYDANGEKMGSKECEEGQIFIEPQGFAIMSDIGKDQGATRRLFFAIDERLNTQSTDLYSTTQHLQSITSSMVRFLHTQVDTRRMPESSHITMHGSSVRRLRRCR